MNRQLVTFCLLLISLNIQTQNLGTISGKVFNNENGLILEGATIVKDFLKLRIFLLQVIISRPVL